MAARKHALACGRRVLIVAEVTPVLILPTATLNTLIYLITRIIILLLVSGVRLHAETIATQGWKWGCLVKTTVANERIWALHLVQVPCVSVLWNALLVLGYLNTLPSRMQARLLNWVCLVIFILKITRTICILTIECFAAGVRSVLVIVFGRIIYLYYLGKGGQGLDILVFFDNAVELGRVVIIIIAIAVVDILLARSVYWIHLILIF